MVALEKRVKRIAMTHQAQEGIPWTCRWHLAALEVAEVVDEQLALAMAAVDKGSTKKCKRWVRWLPR